MLTGPVGVRAAVFGEEVGDGVTERMQAVEVEEAVRRGGAPATWPLARSRRCGAAGIGDGVGASCPDPGPAGGRG